MSGDGEVFVTFGAIQQAQADTAAGLANIERELEDLRTYLKPLTATWTGDAATNYAAQQAQWDAAIADLNEVLRQMSLGLGAAHDNYVSTENTNASMWTG